jgi:hypothetical protein
MKNKDFCPATIEKILSLKKPSEVRELTWHYGAESIADLAVKLSQRTELV